ncbi:hypothetical protein EMIT0P258_60208 [Pseudomonas sp. IT-P258]
MPRQWSRLIKRDHGEIAGQGNQHYPQTLRHPVCELSVGDGAGLENSRVGGSIPSLGTIQIKGLL